MSTIVATPPVTDQPQTAEATTPEQIAETPAHPAVRAQRRMRREHAALAAATPPAHAEWAATHLADLPVLVRFTDEETRTRDDLPQPHVHAGVIVISTRRQRIRINLHRGATVPDLAQLHRVVARARAGYLFDAGWTQRDDGSIIFDHYLPRVPDPRHRTLTVAECTEPDCMEEWHAVEAAMQPADGWQFDHVHGEVEIGAHVVRVMRGSDADTWSVGLDGASTDESDAVDALALADALLRCNAVAARLNTQRTARAALAEAQRAVDAATVIERSAGRLAAAAAVEVLDEPVLDSGSVQQPGHGTGEMLDRGCEVCLAIRQTVPERLRSEPSSVLSGQRVTHRVHVPLDQSPIDHDVLPPTETPIAPNSHANAAQPNRSEA